MLAAVVMLGVVVALLGMLVVGLLRSNADVLRTLHALGVSEDELGSAVPTARRPGRAATTLAGTVAGAPESVDRAVYDIGGVGPEGDAIQVGLEGVAGVTLLAFLSSGCTTCQDMWRAFGTDEVQRVPGIDTRVVVVTRGPEDESPFAVSELAPPGVITVMSTTAWDDYGVPVSPYFLLVDGRRGVLGEGAATTWAKVVELLERSLADLNIDLDASRGQPSRRDLLTGMRHEEHASRALRSAGLDPDQVDGP
ncbi:MAG: hypothetical protein ACT452_14155 [Microthrixaceae bacterium]